MAVSAGLLGRNARVKRHRSVAWDLGNAVRSPCLGAWSGVLAAPWEICAGLLGLLALPIKGVCTCGLYGFVVGLLVGLLLLLLRLLYAPLIMLDRIATGFANGCCGMATTSGKLHTSRLPTTARIRPPGARVSESSGPVLSSSR